MLVSHRYKFIYLKTRKTAGSSIESYFTPYCEEGSMPKSHMTAVEAREKLGPEIWGSYFKFCSIRNPYDKCLSKFFFYRKKKNLDLVCQPGDFEAWLRKDRLRLKRDRRIYLLNGEPCIDFFVRYETLHDDMRTLCERLGIAWEPDRLPRLKSGIRPEWASAESFYTKRSKALVRRAFGYEFKQFGYSFPSQPWSCNPPP